MGLLSASELARVIPINRLPQFWGEARAKICFDKALPFIESIRRGRPRSVVSGALRAVFRRARGEAGGIPMPGTRHPDGRMKSWREMPEAQARLEALQTRPPQRPDLAPGWRTDLELLGRELAECQDDGIKVVALTMPKNPAIQHDFSVPAAYLSDWSRRYRIEFRDYWASGLIPEEDFVDTGHFVGKGAAIVADRLAGLVLGIPIR